MSNFDKDEFKKKVHAKLMDKTLFYKIIDFNKIKVYNWNSLIKLKRCLIMLKYNDIPNWILKLNLDELEFIRKIIVNSGSLKELAKEYNITYPTIRNKLNKLIEKINSSNEENQDEYIEKIKKLTLEDKIDLDVAKELIKEYKLIKK